MLETLERIAVAQIVMAVAMALIMLVVAGAALVLFLQLRSAQHAVRSELARMRPQLTPILERVRDATDDVAGMTGDARRRMDDILHTVEDLHRAVKNGSTVAQERIRRFDQVLTVVQQEAEELLLDAAATAHGVHETARVLREPSARRGASGRGDTSPEPEPAEQPADEEET